MRFGLIPVTALALTMTLSSCGGSEESANDLLVANDVDVTIEAENVLVVNDVEPATETAEPPASKPAPAKSAAPAKPAPAPAPSKAKPPEPKAAEPNVPDPTCLPEHRAAGHC